MNTVISAFNMLIEAKPVTFGTLVPPRVIPQIPSVDLFANVLVQEDPTLRTWGGWIGFQGAALLTSLGAAKFLGGNCFPAGTPVSTEEGLRPIETIRPGDRVWAFDHVADEWKAEERAPEL